jgi:hypothetical protein
MKRILLCIALLIVPLQSVFSITADAYTYGDPNKEELAEVYKKMLVELDQSPPDFATAKKHFETVRKEVDMHMGKDPSKIILGNLEDEDKQAAISNMDKLLVLNIARRLENIEKNFNEYETSKRLLAKGFATYEALAPKVEGSDLEIHQEIDAEFDKALLALGNPGLFGVGKKEADKNRFISSKEKILSSLQNEFDIKSLEVGHFSESASEKESTKNEWTDVSNLQNWIPIILIVAVIAGVFIYSIKKRSKM